MNRTPFHRKVLALAVAGLGWLPLIPTAAISQVLNVPLRQASAPSGSEFINIISTMGLSDRENWIYAQVVSGNVPSFLRTMTPINVSGVVSGVGHTATFYVIPDYLAIGTDSEYFLEPMTPLLAQRICGSLGCTLPTRKMVNQIWTNASVKLAPAPIPPSAEMITVPVFAQHNLMVRGQREATTNAYPLGALVAGDKKDVIISSKIYTNFANAGITRPVVIYGWHYQSGDPIQPLCNGHEETYADYSHGIRLVQDACILDGAAASVTAILTNANLAGLLSDEAASEGTANGLIVKPYYTISPSPAYLITPPRGQSVFAGAALSLTSFATGDQPLHYQWLFNGAALPSATGSNLNFISAQPANAGLYAVIASNSFGSVTSRPAVLRLETNSFPLLFWDPMEADSSDKWQLFWGAANNLPDYTAEFALHYGVLPYTFNGITTLIPPAPHSPDGSSRGLKLTANNGDTNASIAALSVYSANDSFSGDFSMKFDLWINYPGNSGGINSTGSTQFATFGIDHVGAAVNWASPSASPSDGIWFGVDGEGGTSTDYRSYQGNPSGPSIDHTGLPSGGLAASNNIAAKYQSLFPASRFETPGSPGKQWASVEIRQSSGVVTWLMEGTIVAKKTNTSVFVSGKVMLGMMDIFSSIANPARDAFVLYDNVRVEDLSGRLKILSISNTPSMHPRITFSCFPGIFHNIEVSTNLNNWQTAGVVFADHAPLSFVDVNASGNSPRFYRVGVP